MFGKSTDNFVQSPQVVQLAVIGWAMNSPWCWVPDTQFSTSRVHGGLKIVLVSTVTFVNDIVRTLLNLTRCHSMFNLYSTGCPISLVRESVGEETYKEINVDNPEVSVAGIEGNANILPYNVVDLPVFKSIDLPTIENADDYPLFSDYVKPFENALLNTTALEGSNQCDGFPTFRKPFPLDDAGSPPVYFPTVFGRSADGIVFAYDPHLKFYQNTVDNPVRAASLMISCLYQE